MPPPATYRFEITYTAYTARDLVSGFLSRQQYNEMFMADLTAIGVDRPQYHALEKTESAISFLYKPTSRTQTQHKRYLAVAANQNIDLRILNAKTKNSIGLIACDPMINNDRQIWETATSILSQPSAENSKKRKHSELQEAGQRQPFPENAPRKRLRSTWPIDVEPQESNQADILEESAETSINGYPSPPRSAMVSELSEALLPTIEPKDISEKISLDSAPIPPSEVPIASKISISLTSKATTDAPPGPRINPLCASSKKQEVNRLTRELWDVRRESAASAAREANIIEQLEKVGVHASPATTSTKVPPGVDSDPSTEELKRRLRESNDNCNEEKRRRALAEQCLDDVKRECNAPFVVPSLLKAFIHLSKVSHLAGEAVSSPTP
ncbi:hypothetical protein FIBSPDRAFT_1045080 [Athelia psychrophila]|uniref:Uncharacterized protein n=1 Tax=Athelia psychrophila TaxID=1759441 RepID=A0A166IVF8_9AGAM|nr:hypothetical protein FIBSPDRAFT_1045080 [Fibularhizoctonia sp. CBS 109695]